MTLRKLFVSEFPFAVFCTSIYLACQAGQHNTISTYI